MDNRSSRQTVGGQQPDAFALWELDNTQAFNIPVKLTPLIGRGEEFNQIKALLEDPIVRLVTITGPGGIGKTHLAIALAVSFTESFRHSTCFIACEPLQSADLLPEAACLALKLPYAAGPSWQSQLLSYLHEKEICLIFDNLEHLLPDCVPFLVEILEKSPSVKILTTSIERLNTPGEYQYLLSGLAVPPKAEEARVDQPGALGLFINQLGQAGYRLKNAELPLAAHICQQLDGMPLALLLAGSLARVMSLSEISQAVHQGIELRGLNERALEEKHNSIRRVFDRSWSLLSEKERRAAQRLAVFKDSFDLALAERVAGADLALLAGLVDKSIIRRAENGFLVQSFLRRYLDEKLAESGEQAEIYDQFLRSYCELAERAAPELYRHECITWMAMLDSQVNNVRFALEWGLSEGIRANSPARYEQGVRLALALWYYWLLRGAWKEGWQWYRACLRGPVEQLAPALQVRSHAHGALYEWAMGDWDIAAKRAEQALTIARQHKDHEGTALALLRKGWYGRFRNPSESRQCFEESLELYRQLDEPFFVCMALYYLSNVCEDREEEQYLSECLKLALKSGNKRYVALSLLNLGEAAYYRGDYQESMSCYRQALGLSSESKDLSGMLLSNYVLSRYALEEKSFLQASQFIEEYHKLAQIWGSSNLTDAYLLSGFFQRATGNYELAEEAFNQAIHTNREFNDERSTSQANYGLGWIAVDRKNYPAALRYYRKALGLFDRSPAVNTVFDWLHILDAYACAVAASEQFEQAVIIFGVVETIFTHRGYQLTPLTRANHEQWLAYARKGLDTTTYARAWRKGQAMQLAEAVAYALAAGQKKDREADPQPALKNPAGLTARELDVLRLVAAGYTDAQVAEKLVLSPRTINAHLTSIYSKLDVNSRTAATRFAFEHHLVD